MNTERAQVGWRFWVWWMLATVVVPTAVSAILVIFVESLPESDQQIRLGAWFLGVVLVLATITIAQWVVLRRQIPRAKWWVVAGIVALVVGSVVGLVAAGAARFLASAFSGVLGADFTEAAGIIAGLVVSFAVGIPSALVTITIAQWLVLRRHVSRAGLWLLVPIVSLGVSRVVGSVVDLVAGEAVRGALPLVVGGQIPTLGNFIGVLLAVCGAVALSLAGYGAVSGGVMVWLLRQPAANEIGPRQVN